MILILVDQITPRIQYTFDFVFASRGLDYELCKSVSEFEKSEVPYKLNYSGFSSEVRSSIAPSILLKSTELINIKTKKAKQLGQECLSFEGTDDIVASVFYVLTRYEEYLSSDLDQFGRYKFSSSVLSRFNWIEQAVCDRWSKAIIEFIHPDLYINYTLKNSLKSDHSRIVPTFDIDNTYAYRFKSGKRKQLAQLKDLFYLRFNRLKERKLVNDGGEDPYDTYDKIKDVASKYSDTKLFWLVESNGEKDRNLDINEPNHKALIRELSTLTSVNLHPSFASFGVEGQIGKEIQKLESITGDKIDSTRQHFLRFRLPLTFQELIRSGVKNEYSMGFAERAGFRCGTARMHKWFDLSINKETALVIHPFIYMDGTLHEYMRLDLDQSQELISKLFREVKEFGGQFIFIWHNETIGDYGQWKGWSSILDYTLELDKNG